MTTANRADVFAVAYKFRTLGRCVIPSGGGDKYKKAQIKWSPFQKRLSTEAELQNWQKKLNPSVWAMITGKVSGCFIVDNDSSREATEMMDLVGLKPHTRTPRGGSHYCIKQPDFPVKTMVDIMPHVDIRGEGGYANFVGGTPDGAYEILQYPTDDSLIPFESLPLFLQERIKAESQTPVKVSSSADEDQPHSNVTGLGDRIVKQAVGKAKEGTRNATGFDLACQLRDNRITQADASPLMLQYANAVRDLPSDNGKQSPYTEKEALESLASAYRRAPREPCTTAERTHMYNASGQDEYEAKGDKNGTHIRTTSLQNEVRDLSRFEGLSKRVRLWVEDTTGWWETRELDSDLNIRGSRDKENRKKILQRLREQGVIEQHPKINKQYRFINTRVTSLEFKTASNTGILPLRWPMGIERYVNLFPGNIAVVAGSPNSGKTALLLNLIHLNQDTFPIYYFCSEMGAVELRNRLDQFPGMSIEDWKFQAKERASAFADIIEPDCVNIIDYLEMTTELYEVNTHLTAISRKLGTGLALVALQKKQGATFGRGQEFGLEKPKLYLSMDRGKLQIVKGKSWAVKNVDPHGLEVGFKIAGGCQFEITRAWDWVKP